MECAIKLDEATISFSTHGVSSRPVSVYNAARNRSIDCFVLGHDVIGLALMHWEVPAPTIHST